MLFNKGYKGKYGVTKFGVPVKEEPKKEEPKKKSFVSDEALDFFKDLKTHVKSEFKKGKGKSPFKKIIRW